MISRTFTGRVKYVWSKDAALDVEDENFKELWKEYRETFDVSKLPVVDGGVLATFDIAALSEEQFARVSALQGDTYRQAREAVAYGLRDVKGYTLLGQPVELKFKKVDGQDRLTKETLEKLARVVVLEVGTTIVEISLLYP